MGIPFGQRRAATIPPAPPPKAPTLPGFSALPAKPVSAAPATDPITAYTMQTVTDATDRFDPIGFEKKLRDFTKSAKGLGQSLSTRFQDGYLDSFRSDANAFATGYASAQVNLHNTADSLLKDIEAMRPVYGDDWADDAARSVKGALTGIDGYSSQVRDDALYWSRYKSEADYSAAMFGSGAESGEELRRMAEAKDTQALGLTAAADPALLDAQQEYAEQTPYWMLKGQKTPVAPTASATDATFYQQVQGIQDFMGSDKLKAAELGLSYPSANEDAISRRTRIEALEEAMLFAQEDNPALYGQMLNEAVELQKELDAIVSSPWYIQQNIDRWLELSHKDALTDAERQEAKIASDALRLASDNMYGFGSKYDENKAAISNGYDTLAGVLEDKASESKAFGLGFVDSVPGISSAYADVQNSQFMQDVNNYYSNNPEISKLANTHNPFEEAKKSNPLAFIAGSIIGSLAQNAIPTGNLGFADDALRGLTGTMSSKADDLLFLLSEASSATGKSGDDIIRLIASSTGKSTDDIMKALAGATGKSGDDITRMIAGVSGSSDDAADVVSGQADELTAWVVDWYNGTPSSGFDDFINNADDLGKSNDLVNVVKPEYNESAILDIKQNYANFNFNKYLRSKIGEPPIDMIDPHAHHILFKEGKGAAQKTLVEEGQALLKRYGIDPIFGTENLVWAPNRIIGQHDYAALKNVVEQLKMVEQHGGDYDDILEQLQNLGQLAARRRAN